jgi:cation diffusion facilitator CzcD-associated flavoprotein CzcO
MTMRRVETLVVGAGQAGLAVSRCLTEHGADHIVVERGRVAERWRTARWDSLRLITPNWMSRLPGWSYSGADPDGYMASPELVSYLEGYAGSFAAPLHEGTTVERVEAAGRGLRVLTDQQTWLARNVVVAAGTEDRAYVPSAARGVEPGIHQLPASRYRGPGQLPDGGVLVVGASASGAQIADELRRCGRPVVISVGRHSRLPRRYRGRSIDAHIARSGSGERTSPADRGTAIAPRAAPTRLDLRRAGITTVIWATGYRPAYPWLPATALDHRGEIRHHRGVTDIPGLYVLGLKFLHRRNSSFVDGVGHDARFVAAHLTRRMTSLALAPAIAPSVALHLT